MSPGKIAAQASHAAVEAYIVTCQNWKGSALAPNLLDEWRIGGHYTKLVMLAEDTEHLLNINHYIEERGFRTKLIIDEGRTEIKPFSATALGVEVVDRDDPHTAATFGDFKTYREPKLPKPHPGLNFLRK